MTANDSPSDLGYLNKLVGEYNIFHPSTGDKYIHADYKKESHGENKLV